MRFLAAALLLAFSVVTVGCIDGGVLPQDSQQGEWSNFHKKAHQETRGPMVPPEKPGAEK